MCDTLSNHKELICSEKSKNWTNHLMLEPMFYRQLIHIGAPRACIDSMYWISSCTRINSSCQVRLLKKCHSKCWMDNFHEKKSQVQQQTNAELPPSFPIYGGFLKWWYPTTMGFPTKNDHFGVFRGYHRFKKHPYTCSFIQWHQLAIPASRSWMSLTIALGVTADSLDWWIRTEMPLMYILQRILRS